MSVSYAKCSTAVMRDLNVSDTSGSVTNTWVVRGVTAAMREVKASPIPDCSVANEKTVPAVPNVPVAHRQHQICQISE